MSIKNRVLHKSKSVADVTRRHLKKRELKVILLYI